MTVSADDDLAMILPLPVPQGALETAVRFVDLSAYAELFADLARHSFSLVPASASRGMPSRRAPLAVVNVGSFEASFVPTIADFDRLDPRFRLPAGVWSQLPDCEHFGFAVFKLRKGNHRIHPMALVFPSARPDALFFPTVHVHDGMVHPDAEFDHTLYCQRRVDGDGLDGWRPSQKAGTYMDVKRTSDMVDADRFVYRLDIQGHAPNRDMWLPD